MKNSEINVTQINVKKKSNPHQSLIVCLSTAVNVDLKSRLLCATIFSLSPRLGVCALLRSGSWTNSNANSGVSGIVLLA